LVELHGGRVEASSPGLDRGSEFVVTLPRVPERRTAAPKGPDNAPVPRRVLVVDDERDSADAFAELLTLEGHVSLATYDGPSTLDAVRKFRPDAVFLDLGLPRMDGYEVASKLREEHGSGMLLVALTGYQRDDARLAASGFDDHLIKPPSMEKVSALLALSK
jgi:two-component system CheB/CheR fusion protein